jgi:hypothetical protein
VGIPAAAILLFKYDEIAVLIKPRFATRIVEQHESEKARSFRWGPRRHQPPD